MTHASRLPPPKPPSVSFIPSHVTRPGNFSSRTPRTMRSECRRASAELRKPLFHGGGFQAFFSDRPPFLLSVSLSLRQTICASFFLAAVCIRQLSLWVIPIDSFCSTAARNSILQAFNHWPSEKVWELQICEKPTSQPRFPVGVRELLFPVARFFLPLYRY